MKTSKYAIFECLDYQIPVTQLKRPKGDGDTQIPVTQQNRDKQAQSEIEMRHLLKRD